ncbi:hypothetical protein [Shinella granuli]|uniref:Uncharacterized protein n=1 Tax=Shinella granuli TaxID=323621 RepID=A0A4R2CYD9_SHIGR|nr:hypothetical protein [Shinella granuli]TCN46868.1 hypothetical protein EV665_10336 [Shinella granuli]
MPDEKKPVDPVLDRMLRALARMPDPGEPDPAKEPPPKKKKRRGKDTLHIKWVFAGETPPQPAAQDGKVEKALDPVLQNIVRVIARKEAQRDLDRGVTINDLMREYEQSTDTRTIEELPRFTPPDVEVSKKSAD